MVKVSISVNLKKGQKSKNKEFCKYFEAKISLVTNFVGTKLHFYLISDPYMVQILIFANFYSAKLHFY